LEDSQRRIAAVRELELFNEEIFFRDVYQHVLQELGVSRQELRSPVKEKKSVRT
jgi:hypothetical protein